MTKWEDIVKHKMEEFDEPLPESVLAESAGSLLNTSD